MPIGFFSTFFWPIAIVRSSAQVSDVCQAYDIVICVTLGDSAGHYTVQSPPESELLRSPEKAAVQMPPKEEDSRVFKISHKSRQTQKCQKHMVSFGL